MDCLSSPHVKNALDNIQQTKQLVILILFVKDVSVIARELELNNNSSTDTYNNAGGLYANDIIDGKIRDLKIKFGIDNIPIENH